MTAIVYSDTQSRNQ